MISLLNKSTRKATDQRMSPEVKSLHAKYIYLREIGVIWGGTLQELELWLQKKEKLC